MSSSNDLPAGIRLRSAQWYAGDDRNAYIHRAWMRRGVPGDAFTGRPHIAIANTASDLTPCNAHLTEVAASVKNGVYEAGGIPLELPVVSLGETLLRPTAMLWRNMAAMATEEMLRANPIDGVVLLGGCDKTIPSLLMAAASVDLPAVVVPGGRMLTGTFRGVALGCGTDVWRLSEEVRAGAQGVRDMVRICDGRMSGTAYGTVVLHVAPEAAAGGPLALVQTGDEITLDVPSRTLMLEVSEEELGRRRPNPATPRGLRQSRPRLGAALHRPRTAGRHGRRPRLPRRRHRRSREP
jgi:dihydroxyacid dehydratase/phosphogluconate dehydratase